MDWFRWHTGSTTDPKFRVVARRAAQAVHGVRLSDVLAVWAMLLERASEADERGVIEGYDCEGADVLLDLPEGAACAIVKAMQDKRLLVNERVAKWDQRQPKREDSSAQRTREYRERKREKESQVTHGDASRRSVTHGDSRGEEIRREENKDTPLLTLDQEPPARASTQGEQPGVCEGSFEPIPELDGMPLEFQDLARGYPAGRVDLVPSFKAYMGMRKAPGFSIQRVLGDVATRCKSSKWNRGYAPNLSRYLREQQWMNPPEDDGAPPGNDAMAQFLAMTSEPKQQQQAGKGP